MKTETQQLTKLPELDEYAMLLKDNGYTIILTKEPSTYFHFFKDGKMGYVQKSYYSGYDFSSTHKPCKEYGTGLGIFSNVMALDLQNADRTINAYGWGNVKNSDKIKHYSSPEEYINYPVNNILKHYIL